MNNFNSPPKLPKPLPEVPEEEQTAEKFAELIPLMREWEIYYDNMLEYTDGVLRKLDEVSQKMDAFSEKAREDVRKQFGDNPELLEQNLGIIDDYLNELKRTHDEFKSNLIAMQSSVSRQREKYGKMMREWRSTLS